MRFAGATGQPTRSESQKGLGEQQRRMRRVGVRPTRGNGGSVFVLMCNSTLKGSLLADLTSRQRGLKSPDTIVCHLGLPQEEPFEVRQSLDVREAGIRYLIAS